MCTVTREASIPSAFATSERASWGLCVGDHTSQRSPSNRATLAGGSMGACARCGTVYSATTRRAEAESARSTSPAVPHPLARGPHGREQLLAVRRRVVRRVGARIPGDLQRGAPHRIAAHV